MSTLLMGLCWPLAMSPTCKAVLISLADQANDQGYCWPSMATLAERTCLSERAVRNAVRALEALGVLRVDLGAMKSNRYVLKVHDYLRRLQAEKPQVSDDSHRHVVPPGTSCPPAPDAGQPAPRAGVGGTTCPLTIIEPIQNTPQAPHRGPEAPPNDPRLGQPRGGEGSIAFSAWLASCRASGQKAIPEDDPVFDYAATVGISAELVALCWREFKRRNEGSTKRWKDWRRRFRQCVEGNWYGLWHMASGNAASLSSKGEQAKRFFEAADAADATDAGGAA